MADTLETIEAGIWSIYEEHLKEGVTIETIKELMEAETWLSGEQAAEYFNVSVGEENQAAAAIQEYTTAFCKNTPETLTGKTQTDKAEVKKEMEIRKEIVKMTISNM